MPASKTTHFSVHADSKTAYTKTTRRLKVFGNAKTTVFSRYSLGPHQDRVFRDFYKQLGVYVRAVKHLVKNVTTFEEAIEATVFMAFAQNHGPSSAFTGAHMCNHAKAALCGGSKQLLMGFFNLVPNYHLHNMVAFVRHTLDLKAFPNLAPVEKDLLHKWIAAAHRIESGEWISLDWTELNSLPLTQELLTNYLLQLPHVSTEKPDMIAYYQNADKIGRGIETRTAAGRYFRKLCPQASDDLIRELATSHTQRVSGSDLNFVESSDDPSDWYRVYDNGPNSCIGDRPWAAEAYAYPGNGLRLAYLGTMDNPTARSIVVDAGTDPETGEPRKGFIRMYGDMDRLKFALRIAGYGEQVELHEFGPVKLRKIYHDGRLVCPYVDGCDPQVTEQDDYLVIDDYGDYSAQNSNNIGYLEDNSRNCDKCDSRVNDDEVRYVEGHGDICDSCIDHHFQIPEVGNRYGNYFHNDDCVVVFDYRGDATDAVKESLQRSDDYVRLENAYDDVEFCHIDYAAYVEGSGYYHPDDDDIVYLHYRHEYVLKDNTVDDYDGDTFHEDDVILLHDGCYAHEEDLNLVYTRHGWALDRDCTELDESYDIDGHKETITHALDSDEEELLRNQVTEETVQEVTPV